MKLGMGYIHLTQLLWLLHFMNALVVFDLLSQRVLHTIIIWSSPQYWIAAHEEMQFFTEWAYY